MVQISTTKMITNLVKIKTHTIKIKNTLSKDTKNKKHTTHISHKPTTHKPIAHKLSFFGSASSCSTALATTTPLPNGRSVEAYMI